VIVRDGEWMTVQGSLNMDTVPALFESGLKQLAGDDLNVDFSRVESVDSAAVGLLLGWARSANRLKHVLRVKGLPEELLSLAHLYGVAEMLPQQTS
jgi:phospholipid transport system transporter-binding protein